MEEHLQWRARARTLPASADLDRIRSSRRSRAMSTTIWTSEGDDGAHVGVGVAPRAPQARCAPRRARAPRLRRRLRARSRCKNLATLIQRFTLLVDLGRLRAQDGQDEDIHRETFTTIFNRVPQPDAPRRSGTRSTVFNARPPAQVRIPESLSSKFVCSTATDEGDHSVLTDYVDASALPRGPSADDD